MDVYKGQPLKIPIGRHPSQVFRNWQTPIQSISEIRLCKLLKKTKEKKREDGPKEFEPVVYVRKGKRSNLAEGAEK